MAVEPNYSNIADKIIEALDSSDFESLNEEDFEHLEKDSDKPIAEYMRELRTRYKGFNHPDIKDSIVVFLQSIIADHFDAEAREAFIVKHGGPFFWPPVYEGASVLMAKSMFNTLNGITFSFDHTKPQHTKNINTGYDDALYVIKAIESVLNINPSLLKGLTVESPGGFSVEQWNAKAAAHNKQNQGIVTGEKIIDGILNKKSPGQAMGDE